MTTLLSLMVVLAAAPAMKPPAPVPTKLELTDAQRKATQLLTDGKGHYVAVVLNDNKVPESGMYFYGDGKQFFHLRAPSSGSDGSEGTWNVTLWEPRETWGQSGIQKTARDGYNATCGNRTVKLTVVPAADAGKLVEAATFNQPRWTRRPYRLSRDDKGNYYFVDYQRNDADFRDEGTKKDLRLYVGPRGKLKLQAMTNIVSDSEGEIFSTKSGELRLVSNPGDTKWISGKSEIKLLNLPVEDNAKMIYTELGVYDRELLGTPCDDI